MKLSLFYSRPYEFTNKKNEIVTGAVYIGFNAKGEKVKFTSPITTHRVDPSIRAFNEQTAFDYTIEQRFDEFRMEFKNFEKVEL